MARKLPPDFDADWYASAYPDVAMSGLGAREHYLRFGALLGRQAKRPPPPPQTTKAKAEPVAKAADQPAVAPESIPPAEQQPKPKQPKPVQPSPIIDRPEGFDPAAALPKAAPATPDGDFTGPFSLEALAALPAGSDSVNVTAALQAYAKLLCLKPSTAVANEQASVSCGAMAFQAGPTRIENAWFAGPSRLRLMLAGAEDAAPDSIGRSVRAYQAFATAPAELRMLGEGVQLPPIGPVIHDLELVHPQMPLLLALVDRNGIARAFTLLPFPSLLPGGLHGVELKALQTQPNPIDDFWALSDALLQEAIGGENWPARSITAISISADSRPDHDPLLTSLAEWLTCVFGIALNAEPGPLSATPGSPRGGLQLLLPREFVPTISALVSRRLEGIQSASMIGSYLVAEAATYQPRWSIAVPADFDPTAAIPVLRRSEAQMATTAPADVAPIPLAIAIRSPAALPLGRLDAADAAKLSSASLGPLSVLVDASNERQLNRLVGFLRAELGKDVQLFVRHCPGDAEASLGIQRTCRETGAAFVGANARLQELARDAVHETLVTISDRIELADRRALIAIVDLLLSNENYGSASCTLLSEKIIKKDVVLQPASGGLFPTGVSFASGPRLAFGEPDTLQALPGLNYPVLANTLLFTAWRRRALVELPGVPGTGAAAAEDVRIGLDLMRAGYRNWCTTRCTAQLSGPYTPREGIDPVGPGYLQPQRWEEILGRVTVVRELF